MANKFLSRSDEIVDGLYPLGAVINRSIRSTVYKTEFGKDALPAVIKIREYESSISEELMERWRNAMELAHPNLLKIYATGSSVLNGLPMVYVVMERADESLNNVLAERALTGDEARELLVPIVAALHYLHGNGCALSRLGASNVLAVQDQVKLASDNAIRLSNGGSAAEDMKDLGVLIVQALTQRIPNGNGQPDPDSLRMVPEPFRDIARHCLDPDSTKRWTAEQLEATLKGQAGSVPTGDPVLPKRMPAAEKMPAFEAHATMPPAPEDPDAVHSKTGIPKWIYAGLAALILIVVLSAVTRKRERDVAPARVIPSAPVPERNPGPEIVERTAPVEGFSPARQLEPRTEASRAQGRKADGWSVIVATYSSRELAEKRMRDMKRRWPKFNITVQQPGPEKTRYLIVLGQNLSEDQAEDLRKRAVRSGLPRDTYIKRVM